MKYTTTFNDIVNEGFSNEVAVLAIILLSMNISKNVKNRHLKKHGLYAEGLVKAFKDLMWDEDPERIKEAISIWEVLHDYDTCRELQGLGGCEFKTIHELIAKNN